MMNNDLAMGPLPVRARGGGAGRSSWVILRCGVRDCPEILGGLGDWASGLLIPDPIDYVRLSSGYIRAKDGIFIRTRRAAFREEGTRHFLEEILEEYLDLRLGSAPAASGGLETKCAYLKHMLSSLDIYQWTEEDLATIKSTNLDAAIALVRQRILEQARGLGKEAGWWPGQPLQVLPAVVKCGRCGRLSKITEADKRRPKARP